MKKIILSTAATLWLFSANACPVCDSDTGRQVREGIFGPDFGSTLTSVIAPFPVVLALVGMILWMPGLLEPRKPRTD